MSDILTITLNPALDMSTGVDAMRPEDKLRCDAPVFDPGGGGINVARAVRLLGGQATAFVALAGFRGQQIAALLTEEGVPTETFALHGETRLSLAVTDRAHSAQYRFVMPGPEWSAQNLNDLYERVGALVTPNMQVVLSGSQPPGLPSDLPSRLVEITHANGASLTLDTSGPALTELLRNENSAPDVLRLDGAESEMLAGRKLGSLDAVADFARSLLTGGKAQNVVLALGPEGSVLATHDAVLHAVTPPVSVTSKVGAGDSFVGAFTLARGQGLTLSDALCHGVAAASAAVTSPATELCSRKDMQNLLSQVSLTKL